MLSTLDPDYAKSFARYRLQDRARLNNWVHRISSQLIKRESAVVVDVGCGAGRFTIPLSQFAAYVIGVDKSLFMLRQALQRQTDKCIFVLGASECLPLRSESADIVFASMLLEHLPDKGSFFAESRRILRRNGKVLLRTNLPADIDKTTWYDFVPTARRLEAARTLSLDDLAELGKIHGFDLDRFESFLDAVDNELTAKLADRLLARSYEVLFQVSEEEIMRAVKAVNSLEALRTEWTSSSLVTFHKAID